MQRAGVLAALAVMACGEPVPRQPRSEAMIMPTSSTIATRDSTKLAAAAHACAITDGRASCWGYDHFRQLGHVARGSCDGLGCEPVPCMLATPDTFTTIAAGENTTCAIGGKDRSVWCWGEAHVGQLGADPGGARCGNALNSWPCSKTPTKIEGLHAARSLAIAHHVCAALESGEVWCWGANDSGQLGTASHDQCVPNLAELTGRHGVRSVSPPLACSRVPLRVPGIAGVVQVAAGRQHTCALTAGGNVLCWGDNTAGQLGLGGIARADVPTRVPELDGIVGIAAAMSTTCAWRSDGQALCWGSNDSGQLGVATTETCNAGLGCSRTPREVLDGVAEVGVGFTHACARRRDGSVACWGLDADDQLGYAGGETCGPGKQACSSPRRVPGVARATGLAVGQSFTCALVDDRIDCWGRNVLGSLGDGSTRSRKQPAPIAAAKRCE